MAPKNRRPSRPSPRRKPKPRTPAQTDFPPIDDSLTLDTAVGGIQLAEDQEDDNAWRIGAYFAAIVDRKFPLPKGYVHAEDYVRSQMKKPLAARTLRLDASIAREFTEATAVKYGVAKLGELITLATRQDMKIPADPGPVQVSITGKDGTVQTKAFADCTEGDLLAALHVSNGPQPSQKLQKAVKAISDAVTGSARTEIERHRDHVAIAFRDVTCDNKGELQNFASYLMQVVSGLDDWADDSAHRAKR